MKKHLSTIFMSSIFLMLVINKLPAQDLSQPFTEVVPPSPSISSLMHFEEVPIDYYTGQPDISIPISSIPLHKGLALSLALRYTTMGVRVQERSGWLGTSWAMNSGGVIARTVRGFPDESRLQTRRGVWHNNDFWNYDQLSDSEKNEFNWNVLGTSIANYDTELDLYQYSFPGGSGRFVVVRSGGGLRAEPLDLNENTRILLTYDPTTFVISRFDLIDQNGYKYVFNVLETTTTIPNIGTISQGSIPSQGIGGSGDQYTNTSAWHLSSISTSNNQELATFDYNDDNFSYLASRDFTFNEISFISGYSTVPPDLLNNPYNQSVLKPKQVTSATILDIRGKKISEISFRDGTSIEFLPSSIEHPETGGDILSDIVFKNEFDEEYKRFNLSHSIKNDRLWLDEVTEKAGTLDLNYQIHYTSQNSLPDFFGVFDEWGFGPFGAGLISHIVYPTGGKREFVFEPNSFSYYGNKLISEFEPAQHAFNTTERAHFFYFSGTYNFTADDQIIDQHQNVTFTHDQNVLVTNRATAFTATDDGLADFDGSTDLFDNTWLYVKDSEGNVLQSLRLNFSGNTTLVPLEVTAGENLQLVVETGQQGAYQIEGDIRIIYEELVPRDEQDFSIPGAGARIREVNSYDKATNRAPDKQIKYSYRDKEDPTKSSGSIDNTSGVIENKYSLVTRKHLFHDIINHPDKILETDIIYNISRQGANASLTKGNYVGYERVVVSEIENGHTVYTYTNPKTYRSGIGFAGYPFFPASNIGYKQGLLLSTKVYNEAGQLLKEANNHYEFLETVVAPFIKIADQERCGWTQFYNTYSQYLNKNPDPNKVPTSDVHINPVPINLNWDNCGPFPPSHILGDNNNNYDLTATWARLTETTETDYFYDVNGLRSSTDKRQSFVYNQSNHQVTESNLFIDENGVQVSYTNNVFFPSDVDILPEFNTSEKVSINELIGQNRITTPVLSVSYRNGILLTKQQYKYQQFDEGPIAVKSIHLQRRGGSLEERVTFDKYDSYENLLEGSKSNDVRTVHLWAYNGSLLVARIENATHQQVDQLIDQAILDNPANEAELAAEISKLRNSTALDGTFITTYSYRLGYGVNAVVGPNSLPTTYHYDDLGRLIEVRDHENNIRQYAEYKYQR